MNLPTGFQRRSHTQRPTPGAGARSAAPALLTVAVTLSPWAWQPRQHIWLLSEDVPLCHLLQRDRSPTSEEGLPRPLVPDKAPCRQH